MKNVLIHKQKQLQQELGKPDLKDRIMVPLLGIGVLLLTIASFILLLYIITIIIRLLFVL